MQVCNGPTVDGRASAAASLFRLLFTYFTGVGLLGLGRQDVVTQRRAIDHTLVVGDEIEDLLIPEPGGRVAMHLQQRGAKLDPVASVFQGLDIGVEGLPIVGDDRPRPVVASSIADQRFAEPKVTTMSVMMLRAGHIG